MKSAFDEEEEYDLTELGKQFVRYTMDEVMPRIAAPAPDNQSTNTASGTSATHA
jgi:hypothetical protein